MNETYVRLAGIGHHVGEMVVSNEDMVQRILTANKEKKARQSGGREQDFDTSELALVSTTPQWIFDRSGIKERRYSTLATSQLAAKAIRVAVTDARKSLNELEFLIVASVSHDCEYSPPTASLVVGELGLSVSEGDKLRERYTVDVSNACSSFGSALQLGYSLVKSGMYRCGAVVGADRMSSTVDPSDRTFSILVGDAAAAVVLVATNDQTLDSFPWGASSFFASTDPAGASNIRTPAGGSASPLTLEALLHAETTIGFVRPDRLAQKGKAVYKEMQLLVPRVVCQSAERLGLSLAQIDILALHQANLRLNELIIANLRLRGFAGYTANSVTEYGNTTSAAIPLSLSLAVAQNRIERGMTILMVPFGGGYTAMTIAVRWTAEEYFIGV